MDDICPNCSSSEHSQCCSRCGKAYERGGYEGPTGWFCSAKCARDQHRDDKLSSKIENNIQAARLTAATRRGLRAIRSLADVTACNGIDMTMAEVGELRLAIGWIDKQLSKWPNEGHHHQNGADSCSCGEMWPCKDAQQ